MQSSTWTRPYMTVEAVKVENRGGARVGAGRKPTVKVGLSTYQVAKMLRKAKKAAKRYGKDIDDVLIEIIYDANIRKSEVLSAIKVFKECTMIKPTENGEANKVLGPAVFLPDQHPKIAAVKTEKAA